MSRSAVLLALLAALVGAEADPRPIQYRVWGTVAPPETDRIVAPAPYQEALPAGFDPGPEVPTTPELLSRGFLPFRCHTQALIHPRVRPGPAELADPALDGFASLGEYTSLCLGVHALRDLAGVEASLGDLTGDGGARLAAANLEVRWVKFLPNPVARYVYRLDPKVLERRPAKAVAAGTSAYVWLTVHLPPTTAPGVYRGRLHLTSPGCPAQEVPVAFRALDLGLEAADRHLAMMYTLSRATAACGDVTRLEAEFADMAAHGMNSLSYMQQNAPEVTLPDGSTRFDFSAPSRIGIEHNLSIRRCLDVARDAGLTRDAVFNLAMIPQYAELWTGTVWGTEACDAHIRRLVAAWTAEAASAKGWPRLMFSIGDEPTSKNGRLEPSRRTGDQVKAGSPGVTTTCFCVGGYMGDDDLTVLDPVLDVPVVPVLPTSAYRDTLVKRAKPFWMYNGASPHRPLDARMSFGWGILSTGAAGMEQFQYRTVNGCTKDRFWESAFVQWPAGGFDDLEPTWCYSWRVDDGCLPSPSFEAIRAGVGDLRYVQTATTLAARAVADPRPEVRAAGLKAQARLAALHQEFDYFLPNGAFRGFDWLHTAGTELLDLRRWEIARLILELRGGGAKLGARPAAAGTQLALAEMRCEPLVAAHGPATPSIVAASGTAGVEATTPFSVLGSVRSGSPLPATQQTRFSVVAGADALRFTCRAAEVDPARPVLLAGGFWHQDGVEIFLVSPAQDGLVHQVAATALGEVALITHRRTDREHCELLNDQSLHPPVGLVAHASRMADAWQVEVTIPYAALGLGQAPQPGEVWGMNVCRTRRADRVTDGPEHSSWSPLEGRYLEPAAFGRMAIGRDPGVSAGWCEAVGSEREAFAALELENRGPAPQSIRVKIGTATFERAVAPGSSRLALPLAGLTLPCQLPVRLVQGDGEATLATLAVSAPAGGDLVVAGVGSRHVDSGRGIRPALSIPGVVWPHAQAIPVVFDLPVAGRGLSGWLEVRDGDRVLLRQELTGMASAHGRLALAAQHLVPRQALSVSMAVGGSTFRTDLRIGDGFLD